MKYPTSVNGGPRALDFLTQSRKGAKEQRGKSLQRIFFPSDCAYERK
jgi:hypothetical protein